MKETTTGIYSLESRDFACSLVNAFTLAIKRIFYSNIIVIPAATRQYQIFPQSLEVDPSLAYSDC